MAVLKTLISDIIKKGEYPTTIVDSITISKTRRAIVLEFASESVMRVNPIKQTFVADKPNIELVTNAIKIALTPSERTAIKLLKSPSVGKSK